MCSIDGDKIGVEVMGTHGQFPHRGYKQSYFDYIGIVISECQISSRFAVVKGSPHFVFIPVSEPPLHNIMGMEIKRCPMYGNSKLNEPEYADVIYPNIKLKLFEDKNHEKILVKPDLSGYGNHNGTQIHATDSPFRKAGPYTLDEIPSAFL
jgi:hypothetical protein